MPPTYPLMVANANGHFARRPELKSAEPPRLSMVEIWVILVARLKEATAVIKERFDKRAVIEKEISARSDDWCNTIFLQTYTRLEQLTAELEVQLAVTQNLDGRGGKEKTASALSPFTLTHWQMEERYRALIQLQSYLGSFFERASPAYDQSRTLWWFDPSYHQSNGLNYDRYGAPDPREYETRLLKSLGLGDEQLPIKLLLTSSGVAAFTVLHQYIMTKVVKAGDTIVIAPYLYFESFDHLRSLTHINIINSESFDPEEIIATAERHNAKAVYLDPMTNTVGLDTIDLRRFAQLVSQRDGWADRTLLVDGTLVSGGMQLYDWFNTPNHPKVLYYESAHKYCQMGMDIVMFGFVVYPDSLHNEIGLVRQVTGTTLYSRQTNVLPPIDYNIHQSRMAWITENAERLYQILEKNCSSIAKFNYPVHWRKLGWGHGGNVVTIELFQEELNKQDSLTDLTTLILRAGEEENLALTKGGGLGFSVTRVWPSTPFIAKKNPYMRISVGIDPDEVETLARVIRKGLERHLRASKSGMAQWKLRENGVIKTNGQHFGGTI